MVTASLSVAATACGSSPDSESTCTTAAGPLLDPNALAKQLLEDSRANIEIYKEKANCIEGSAEREF